MEIVYKRVEQVKREISNIKKDIQKENLKNNNQ